MRVACNRCQTKFDVPDERLSGGAVKVRCTECGNTFVVRRRSRSGDAEGEPLAPAPEVPPQAEAPADESEAADEDEEKS